MEKVLEGDRGPAMLETVACLGRGEESREKQNSSKDLRVKTLWCGVGLTWAARKGGVLGLFWGFLAFMAGWVVGIFVGANSALVL